MILEKISVWISSRELTIRCTRTTSESISFSNYYLTKRKQYSIEINNKSTCHKKCNHIYIFDKQTIMYLILDDNYQQNDIKKKITNNIYILYAKLNIKYGLFFWYHL